MMRKALYMAVLLLMTAMMSCGNATDRLKDEVAAANKELPCVFEPGVQCTRLSLTENELVYEFLVDETLHDVESFNQGRDLFVGGVRSGLVNDPDTREMLQMCQEAGIDIVYRFGGNQGHNAEFRVKPADFLN